MKREALGAIGADGWSVSYDDMLICPHSHRVEDDGSCPEGCESPLKGAGLI